MQKYLYNLSYNSFSKTDFKATQKVFIQKKYTMGTTVAKFEKELSKWLNVKNSIMVNSGSSANFVSLFSLLFSNNYNFNKGDEIIVPSLAWSTTYSPFFYLDCKLKIIDIDLNTLNFKYEDVLKAITRKTKMIVAVNILGNPCELIKLRKY